MVLTTTRLHFWRRRRFDSECVGAGATVAALCLVAATWSHPRDRLRLGSGIAAVRKYIRHAFTVVIGTDGSASSDNQNMFEAMRAGVFISRVRGLPPANWVSMAEAFIMATEGSARVLGTGDFIGKIAKGYKVDLMLVDLDHVDFVVA